MPVRAPGQMTEGSEASVAERIEYQVTCRPPGVNRGVWVYPIPWVVLKLWCYGRVIPLTSPPIS